MNHRQFLAAPLAVSLVCASGCGRAVVPDAPVGYLQSVFAGCATDTRVPDPNGDAKATEIRVRDVSRGKGPWLEACSLNPAAPALWDADRRAIAIQDATMEFRDAASGKTIAFAALLGGAGAVLTVVGTFVALTR